MAWMTQDFIDTWRTRQHVASSAPYGVVQVRRGSFRRDYNTWTGDPVGAEIYGETATEPWYPIFTETTDWIEIPNIVSIQLTQSFDQNGVTVATIVLDTVGYEEGTGAGGTYHSIEPGFLAPQRGYNPDTRPVSSVSTNVWSGVLTDMANLRIWQGLGPPERDEDGILEDGGSNGAWVFNGLIDSVDPEAVPNTMSITARMGKTLTDQHVFGWAKSKQLLDPVTFIGRDEADRTTEEAYRPEASSSDADHPPRNVIDNSDSVWRSSAHTVGGVTEWVEIRIPQGRYSTVRLECRAGMELFLGLFLHSQADTDGTAIPPTVDGIDVDTGWYNGGFSLPVPGDNGGWDPLLTVASTASGVVTLDLGHEFEVGKNTIVRAGFRNLHNFAGDYRAEVTELKGIKRTVLREVADSKFIIIEDASDAVRVALRWAGFTEWEVEDAGTSLKGRLVVNRANFLIDIITAIAERTGFVFFLADPTSGESWGVPTFRRNASLLRSNPYIPAEFTDADFISDMKVQESDENRGYIIRVRGKEAAARDGGLTLGGDATRRIMVVYRPPWTTGNRMAGIIRHIIHHDDALHTVEDCTMACYLIAVAEALAIYTASIEIPGLPLVELDDQVGVNSVTTGINSRLWVISREATMALGKTTSWKTTLGGSLMDTPDLQDVIDEILAVNWTPAVTQPVVISAHQQRTR